MYTRLSLLVRCLHPDLMESFLYSSLSSACVEVIEEGVMSDVKAHYTGRTTTKRCTRASSFRWRRNRARKRCEKVTTELISKLFLLMIMPERNKKLFVFLSSASTMLYGYALLPQPNNKLRTRSMEVTRTSRCFSSLIRVV